MRNPARLNRTAKIWKCCCCFTGICCTPVNILLLLVTGWLAFMNPDPMECWTSDAEPGVIYSSDPGKEGFSNYGQIFRVWFLIGFIMVALWSILSIIFMVGVGVKNGVSLCISTFGLILHIVNIVWCVYGFFAFSTPAALTAFGELDDVDGAPTFASGQGDEMMVSGISWLIIWADLAVIVLLYILFPIICCIASCCASKDDD